MAVPILALPVAMVEAAFWAALVATVGAASLLASRFGTAGEAAIALSSITVRADPEHRVASTATANPLTENDFAMNFHARPQTGLDKGKPIMSG